MSDDDNQESVPSFEVVSQIIKLLEPLTIEQRGRVLRTVTSWLEFGSSKMTLSEGLVAYSRGPTKPELPSPSSISSEDEKFSNRPVLSVKDFIFEKNPATDAERMACLGYYLTHYKETPHFKTVDLTRLNAEAAQRSFSNPAVAASNAARDGFFVSAPKGGYKQLSAMGERFVHSLPDRAAADAIKSRMSGRRRRRGSGSSEQAETEESQSESQPTEN